MMKRPKTLSSTFSALLTSTVLAIAGSAMVAEVTPERLLNPDKEPQNWLMNHRTYDGQRFSPLAGINKANVKGLKLAYAVPLGGSSGNEYNEATALAEDGFLYITDSWGVLYKIDGTSGAAGRIVWRMEPKQEKQAPTAVPLSGAISLSRRPTGRPASLPLTRKLAKWCGRPTWYSVRPKHALRQPRWL
jgi:glucose dehydrogenase